jgi:putative heme-binding domain-containing protein
MNARAWATSRITVSMLSIACLCFATVTRALEAPASAKASAGLKQTGGGAAAVQLKREQILEQQLKPLAKPASVPAGGKLYDVLCAMCHRFGPIGQDVGPDLTTVSSRFGRKELLESMLWPSKTVSDQYESELFDTADGKVHHGLVVRETATALQIRTVDSAKPIVLALADIQSRRKSPQSFMPEGLIDGLSQSDIANLVAFLLAGPPKTTPTAR